jgi:hypothetical protein
MPKHHLFGCAVMFAAVVAVLTLSDWSTTGLGVLAVALLCPVVMVIGMYVLSSRPPR